MVLNTSSQKKMARNSRFLWIIKNISHFVDLSFSFIFLKKILQIIYIILNNVYNT